MFHFSGHLDDLTLDDLNIHSAHGLWKLLDLFKTPEMSRNISLHATVLVFPGLQELVCATFLSVVSACGVTFAAVHVWAGGSALPVQGQGSCVCCGIVRNG